jgi:competence protein ComEA
VNLNTATADELRQLPGIGPALAAAIIEARPFVTVDDLLRVRNIGPRRLAAPRGWCVV